MNKFLIFFIIFVINTSYANNFSAEYKVSTTGIKIGNFSWSLSINDNIYQTEIDLKNSGIFSPLYKFEGSYLSTGVIENNIFKTKNYKQFWKTKKKTKIVKMSFDDYLIELKQEPIEEEIARVNLESLFLYFDPITSFLNILNGEDEAKTIDGRRVYRLKKNEDEEGSIVLKIEDYTNIWADHKRNDLKKIEFFIEDEFLPYEILIHFKERVFKLERI
ncbi:DUF3108 domain-containing protein [Pelagibacteraceae bacterium]|nr:DUF3108 domain-containing protein [Pelagibacteraceae bacterium]